MKICEYCGARLDAGESCSCKNGTDTYKSVVIKKRPLTSEELYEKLKNMTHAEYDAYCRKCAAL